MQLAKVSYETLIYRVSPYTDCNVWFSQTILEILELNYYELFFISSIFPNIVWHQITVKHK